MCCPQSNAANGSNDRATKAAACHFCVRAKRNVRGAVACTVDGLAIGEAVDRPCPRGRFPDAKGLTLAFWIRWRGLAYPYRLWLWAFHRSHRRPSWWPGCGCVDRLKALTERMRPVG